MRRVQFFYAFVLTALLLGVFAGCSSVVLTPDPPPAGNDIRLRRIRTNPVPGLSQREIAGLTGLKEGERYPINRLEAARDTVRSRLRTLPNHPLATLDTLAVLYDPKARYAEIRITVNPGPTMLVDSIAISGPGASASDMILARMRTRTGQSFEPGLWNTDLDRISVVYEENGFPFVRVVTRPLVPEFRDNTIGITLGMEVTPGIAVVVDRIEFAGAKRTGRNVLERVARFPTGTRFNSREVETTRRNLQRTGWFSTVSQGELFRGHDGRYGLLYRLQEQNTSSISGALGYAPEEANSGGVAGVLDVHLGNILGTGRSFDLNWRRDNPHLTSFSIAYREPWILASPVSGELRLTQDVADSQYVALEASLTADAQFGQGWTVAAGVRQRSVTADSLSQGPDSLTYSLIGLTGSLSLDTRDRSENPSNGGYYKAGSERLWPYGNPDTSPGQLLRTSLDLEQAVEVMVDWVGFAGLHLVEVRALDGGRPPLAEWSRIGGAATLRGFSERSLLAPRAGWINLEGRRLLGPRSRLFALLDGIVLDGAGSTRYETSYGLGAQVDTGIGLMTIAVALPTGEGWSAAVVHARVAARF